MPRYRWIAAAVLISLSVAFAARATDGPALHVEMHDAAYRDGERFLLLRVVDRAAEDIGVARLPAPQECLGNAIGDPSGADGHPLCPVDRTTGRG